MAHGAEYRSRNILSHKAYVPGKQPVSGGETIKLNTNENPYPPSPEIKGAILGELESLRLYPNPPANELRDCISKLHGLSAEQVIVGNGSDDILNLCTRCFSDDNLKVGMLDPSYSLYEVVASLQGSALIRVPFADDAFSVDPESVIGSGANLFFITSPHAPSGREYSVDCFRQILEEFEGIVVIDEAYADFASQNALSLLDEFSNLIITRTMSKSYSLAGLRVGYGLSSPEVVSVLDQARDVYNVDRLAQVAALSCLKDRTYFENTRDQIIKERKRMISKLCEWEWKTCPSGANFVFTRPVNSNSATGPDVAKDLFEFLASRRILIRYFPQHELTSSHVRISVGNRQDMDILYKSLIEWNHQEQPK
jgi:histidinol-phosphate aminotransferase